MKKLFLLVATTVLVFIFITISGYRFTAKGAVKAHPFLEKDSKLVEMVKSKYSDVYVYSVKDYYLTIVPQKKGFLWVAPSSNTTKDINDKNDKVRTIGWDSYSHSSKLMIVMVVEVLDDKVFYIEAGPESDRIKKKVENGKYIIFEWEKAYFVHDVNPIALSESGDKLYMYGYNPLTPNFLDGKELRWHRIQD